MKKKKAEYSLTARERKAMRRGETENRNKADAPENASPEEPAAELADGQVARAGMSKKQIWILCVSVIVGLLIILTAILLPFLLNRPSSKYPRATFELSDGRKLEMVIWEDTCPIAATNFIFLAQIGFFDGTIIYDAKEDYHYMRFGDRTGYGTNDTRYRDENFLGGISKDIFNLEVLTQYKTQAAANKLGYKLRKDDGGDKNRFGEQFVVSYYNYNTADFVINLLAGNTSFRLNPPGTTGTSTMDGSLEAFGAFEDEASQEVLQDILYNTEKNPNTGINNTIGLVNQIRIDRVKISNLDNKKWKNFEFISYMNTAYNGSAAWRTWSASV